LYCCLFLFSCFLPLCVFCLCKVTNIFSYHQTNRYKNPPQGSTPCGGISFLLYHPTPLTSLPLEGVGGGFPPLGGGLGRGYFTTAPAALYLPPMMIWPFSNTFTGASLASAALAFSIPTYCSVGPAWIFSIFRFLNQQRRSLLI